MVLAFVNELGDLSLESADSFWLTVKRYFVHEHFLEFLVVFLIELSITSHILWIEPFLSLMLFTSNSLGLPLSLSRLGFWNSSIRLPLSLVIRIVKSLCICNFFLFQLLVPRSCSVKSTINHLISSSLDFLR